VENDLKLLNTVLNSAWHKASDRVNWYEVVSMAMLLEVWQ